MSRGKISKLTTWKDLKAARLKMGLTQVQVARRLGISQAHYNNLENGHANITVHMAAAFNMMRRLEKRKRANEGPTDYTRDESQSVQI